MRIAIDANVLMDVLQYRAPFYQDSAQLLSFVLSGKIEAIIPAHVIPTLYFLVRKQEGRERALESVRIILNDFVVSNCSAPLLAQALELQFSDYEDAVVAATASEQGCAFIITRNVPDFLQSPIPAISPTEFLNRFDEGAV